MPGSRAVAHIRPPGWSGLVLVAIIVAYLAEPVDSLACEQTGLCSKDLKPFTGDIYAGQARVRSQFPRGAPQRMHATIFSLDTRQSTGAETAAGKPILHALTWTLMQPTSPRPRCALPPHCMTDWVTSHRSRTGHVIRATAPVAAEVCMHLALGHVYPVTGNPACNHAWAADSALRSALEARSTKKEVIILPGGVGDGRLLLQVVQQVTLPTSRKYNGRVSTLQ